MKRMKFFYFFAWLAAIAYVAGLGLLLAPDKSWAIISFGACAGSVLTLVVIGSPGNAGNRTP